MYAVLDLLPPAQKRAYLELKGYPPDWKPPALDWQGEKMPRRRPRRGRLEPLAEIGRIMRMRPGLISTWPDEAIERTDEGGE